jgi:hypothetical protein
MADVVGEPREVDEVGIATESDGHASPDLGNLQGVSQPGAWSLALSRSDDLRLVGQPAQRRAVQHAGSVTREVGAVLGFGSRQRSILCPFDHQALPVEVDVRVLRMSCHRRTVCQDGCETLRGSMPSWR